MKAFVKHPTLIRETGPIKQLIAEHGASGYALFWMAMELMGLNDGWHWLPNLLALRCRGLAMSRIEEIIRTSGLFIVHESEGMVVTVNEEKIKVVLDLENTVFLTCVHTRPWAQGDAPTSAQGCAQAGAPDGACAGHCNEDLKRKIKEEYDEGKALFGWMEQNCPSLLTMTEPLTLEQYHELKRLYDKRDIEQVLRDMHNNKNVAEKNRSCYQTARSWLNHRQNSKI